MDNSIAPCTYHQIGWLLSLSERPPCWGTREGKVECHPVHQLGCRWSGLYNGCYWELIIILHTDTPVIELVVQKYGHSCISPAWHDIVQWEFLWNFDSDSMVRSPCECSRLSTTWGLTKNCGHYLQFLYRYSIIIYLCDALYLRNTGLQITVT